jgi:hypothetical protein
MLKLIGRVVVTRVPTIVIDLVMMMLMGFALHELIVDIWRQGHHRASDVIADAAILMIGWGVALEERSSVREIFGMQGGEDEALEKRVDHASHGIGLMVLLFGLFAEMFEQLSDFHISAFKTTAFREVLLAAGGLCIVAGIALLAGHIYCLATIRRA